MMVSLPGLPRTFATEPDGTRIGTGNVARLTQARTYRTAAGPSGPLIANGILYVDANKLYANTVFNAYLNCYTVAGNFAQLLGDVCVTSHNGEGVALFGDDIKVDSFSTTEEMTARSVGFEAVVFHTN